MFLLCYAYKIKNSSKILYYVLLLFCILRYDVGWDYEAYLIELENGVDYLINSRYEPLSKLFFITSAYVGFYPLNFFLFGWLTLLLVFKSIIYSSNQPVLSWLVYYSLPLFFFASLSTLRQSLATAIILYSYRYILENKKGKFILSILIASLFHVSGILGVLLLFIKKINFNRSINIVLFVSSFIFSFFAKDIIISILTNFLQGSVFLLRFQNYINSETDGTSILQYLYYFFIVFNLVFYKVLIKINPRNKLLISYVTFGVTLFNILSFEPISATRLSAFFLIFLIFIIPDYHKVTIKKHSRIINSIIFILLIVISFFYLNIYIKNYENAVLEKVSFLPYKTWINNL